MNTSRLPRIEDFEYEEFLKDDVFVVGYLIILCIIGTIGNGHALVVYYFGYKPSNHRTFVLWLAAIDLIACAVSIPFEIVDIRRGYTFRSSEACKTFRYVNHVANIGSGCLFGVIAIERYRKACCPFGRQMTERESAISCMVTIGMSMLISVPSFYIYASATKPTKIEGLVGFDCTTGETSAQKLIFRIYSGFLLLLSTIVFIICIVMYVNVGKALYRQMSFRRKTQTKHKVQNQHSNNITSDVSNGSSLQKKISEEMAENGISAAVAGTMNMQTEESSVCLDNKKKVHFVNSSASSTLQSVRRPVNFDRTKRITLMFLVATAISYIGILPNIIILIIRALHENTYRRNIAAPLGIFAPVLLRTYFLSNVTNPVVYCFVDNRFRQECNRLYGNIKTLFTKRKNSITIT